MLSETEILGIKITSCPKLDLLTYIVKYLRLQNKSKTLIIYTPNPEQLVFAHEHPKFQTLLNSADINLPDGAGLVWALRRIQNSEFRIQNQGDKDHDSLFMIQDSVSRIPGIELMEDLIKIAAEKAYPVAFIGGRAGAAEKSLQNLQKKYPGLTGWAEEPAELEFRIENLELRIMGKENKDRDSLFMIHDLTRARTLEYFKQLAKRIKENGVKLIFVGLGAPKQEIFISNLKSQISNLNDTKSMILMSVGGAFDVISRKLPRAPKTLQKINLEWLWRLMIEPARIIRQTKLLKFVWLILKSRRL